MTELQLSAAELTSILCGDGLERTIERLQPYLPGVKIFKDCDTVFVLTFHWD
jgi:hypothetical protein